MASYALQYIHLSFEWFHRVAFIVAIYRQSSRQISPLQVREYSRSSFAGWAGFGVRAGGLFFGRAAVLRLAVRSLGI